MKGLAIAEQYFLTYGVPMIEQRFPIYKDRIAAGLVGDGSECFGFDDAISRDHDWGPSFCLWLTRDDFDGIGQDLQQEYDQLPKEYAGISARTQSQWGSGRVGVFEIGAFYRQFIGRDELPESNEQWRILPEGNLAVCTNGSVFNDPLGEFTRIRDGLLAFYPEDVRLKKIASRCMSAAQSGQYNYMRCVRRGEYVAAQYAETKFISDVISIVFLLNKRYKPFYKWMHRALEGLPLLGDQLHDMIHTLVTMQEHAQGEAIYWRKVDLIEEISRQIINVFSSQGLSDSASNFLLDHGPEIIRRIRSPEFQKESVWVE
ncbi:MAG: DUF4037 domain-containing protein [Deltaproteobacteria bacterium]|nr:DUF4037 domain-containing protein [Deltaproteobacteria bacterium]